MTAPGKPPVGKVLVVDDEPDLREVLQFFFASDGYDVAIAGGGNEALRLIAAADFDVVVSDIRMPDGDGFSLIHGVKALTGKKPHVILISGFADAATAEAKSCGAAGLFAKPLVPSDLLDFVKQLISP